MIGQNDLSSKLWEDLVRLESYINCLSQYSVDAEIIRSEILPFGYDNDSDKLINKAIEIVHGSFDIAKRRKTRAVKLDDIVHAAGERGDTDITDQLWSVLICCTNYGSLVDCLHAFVSEIGFKAINVYIEKSNKCLMAELLRAIMVGTVTIPTFTGTQAIEILIELGIEKLRKDYLHIYNLVPISDANELNELIR